MNVYCLKFPETNYYYIGSTTKDPMERFMVHRKSCFSKKPANPKLASVWKKHGDPELIVMGTYQNEMDLIDAEQFYINVSIEDPDCLNLNPVAGRPPSNKGKKHSSETKAKIAVAHTGKKLSLEHRANLASAKANPIIAVDPQKNETIYSSASECARLNDFSQGIISYLIRFGKPAVKGKTKGWSFRTVNNNE